MGASDDAENYAKSKIFGDSEEAENLRRIVANAYLAGWDNGWDARRDRWSWCDVRRIEKAHE